MVRHPTTLRTIALAFCIVSLTSASAQNLPPGQAAEVETAIVEPIAVPFSEEHLAQLELPDGFRIDVFAQDLGNVRMMEVGDDGGVYVTRRDQGDVLLLRDTDGDGRADSRSTVAQNLPLVHGVHLHQGDLYLYQNRSVYRAPVLDDGTLGDLTALITDMPDAGQHPARTLAIGPDGLLYLSVGSTCNNCDEANPENATLVRAQPDGSARNVFAEGLRHTIGFDWHPETGQLFGWDHGSDMRGDEQPPEELNRLEAGNDYGWPFCYADQQVDRFAIGAPPGMTKEQYCATTEGPVLTYTAHASPIGFLFYTGDMFPEAYRNDGFLAMRGSWNRSEPSGYRVLRVLFDEDGNPQGTEDFVADWLLPERPAPNEPDGMLPAQFGRVAGLAVWDDGSLLISEDQNGVIYRVTYEED